MVTTLYLIRHGETEGDGVKRYKGHIDVPLSENGIKQTKRLARYIVQNSSNGLNAIYTSDLSRAIKSAEIIAEPFGLKPIVMPDLRERSFGLWEGMSFDEIREKYPEEFKAWANNPLKFSPPEGESTIEVHNRVIEALKRILSNHTLGGQGSSRCNSSLVTRHSSLVTRHSSLVTRHSSLNNIAIVSHGGVNRIILCHLLGIPLENIFRIEQDYGALNIVEFYDEYPVIKLINYTC